MSDFTPIGTVMTADEALAFVGADEAPPAAPAPESPPAAPAPSKPKRQRPRKQAAQPPQEPAEPPLDVPLPPRAGEEEKPVKSAPSASQAWKLDAEMIGYGVAALFGVIATATGHTHWLRTPEQCAPISEPLQRLYSRLPAAKRKQVLAYLDPGVLLAGVYQVAGPSLAVEMQLAEAKRQGRVVAAPRSGGQQPAAGPPSPAPPADPGKIADPTGIFGGPN